MESKKIELSTGAFALVDADDYPLLSRYTWSESKSLNTSYALTSFYVGKKKYPISMHRMIFACSTRYIDHINRNGLDNRKANLRLTTMSENMGNARRSRAKNKNNFIGIYLNNEKKKWAKNYSARITVDGKKIALGVFENPEDAARAYDRAAIKYRGLFTPLNFPEEHAVQPIERKRETAEELLREEIERMEKKMAEGWVYESEKDRHWLARARRVVAQEKAHDYAPGDSADDEVGK